MIDPQGRSDRDDRLGMHGDPHACTGDHAKIVCPVADRDRAGCNGRQPVQHLHLGVLAENGALHVPGEATVLDEKRIRVDIIESEQFADACGELDKSAGDQGRAGAVCLHCLHQRPAARGECDAGLEDMLDCTDRQALHQANPFGNRVGEVELAVHGPDGDVCNLLADTGFGGPLSVMRTVHLLEKAGAAAVQIEDQAMPKRCGHFAGQRLVEPAEMLSRIDAALSARADPDLVVIARTDARSVLGFEEAMRRARLYAEAGADVIFVEAPRTVEEMRRIPAELGGTPVLLNVVEGGKTPQLPREELQEMGYRLILHANLLLRVMLKAGEDALAHLHEHGDSAELGDRVLGWAQRQALVDLERFDDLENRLSNESTQR